MDVMDQSVRDTRDTGSRRTSTTDTAPPTGHRPAHMHMSRSLRAPRSKPSPSLAYRHDGAAAVGGGGGGGRPRLASRRLQPALRDAPRHRGGRRPLHAHGVARPRRLGGGLVRGALLGPRTKGSAAHATHLRGGEKGCTGTRRAATGRMGGAKGWGVQRGGGGASGVQAAQGLGSGSAAHAVAVAVYLRPRALGLGPLGRGDKGALVSRMRVQSVLAKYS